MESVWYLARLGKSLFLTFSKDGSVSAINRNGHFKYPLPRLTRSRDIRTLSGTVLDNVFNANARLSHVHDGGQLYWQYFRKWRLQLLLSLVSSRTFQQLLESETYYLDLNKMINNTNPPVWQFEYKATVGALSS